MRTFYLSSEASQSALMITLFLTLILSLFLLIIAFGRHHDNRKRYMHLSVFLLLFIFLNILGDAFSRIKTGLDYKTWLPVPMWLLWFAVVAVNLMFIYEIAGLIKVKGQTLSRNSLKQAIDLLPSGICYFSPSGAVKLCNLQMYRLYRTLAQSDLQTLGELQNALGDCDRRSGIIRLPDDKQTYLFPDGRAWHYRQTEVTDEDGVTYTEAVFSDMTELYHKNMELKQQIKQLNIISRELRRLSDNVLILTKEKEVLHAKTKLHDRMGAGLIAVRRYILQSSQTQEAQDAIDLFRQAVSTIKNDNEYPQGDSELDKFMHDAEAIGIKVNIYGELPKLEELCRTIILAMRECMSNGVRHAGATTLYVTIENTEHNISVKITNDGIPPKNKVVPKGGLRNLYRHITDCGAVMEIHSSPVFVLTVMFPKSKEGEE